MTDDKAFQLGALLGFLLFGTVTATTALFLLGFLIESFREECPPESGERRRQESAAKKGG